MALSVALAPSAHAGPWSASIGASQRVSALRSPAAEARARGAWWLWAHGPSGGRRTLGEQDPRVELPVVIAHERDPAAALAEVAALSRWTRGTLEHSLRMQEITGNGQVPEVARLAALRAFGRDTPEEHLTELIARAVPLAVPGDPFADLAARALADLPDAQFSVALQQTAGQPSRRAGVLRAIGLRGDPRWSEAVLDALRSPRGTAQEALLLHAIEAAEALRLIEAAPLLVALAEEDSARAYRPRAVRALGTLGGAFDTAVLARLMEPPITRVAALDAAAAVGDPSLVRACARHLRDELTVDREAAARCVGAPAGDAPRDPRDAAALARALATTDAEAPRVRAVIALESLARQGDTLARDVLSALVVRERDLPSPAAIAALRGVVEGGGRVDDDVLTAWLSAPDPVARQAAAHAVGVFGGATSAAVLADTARAEHDDEARGAMVLAAARALGARATALIELVDETAFSLAQVAMVAHARRIVSAQGGARAPYRAQDPLRHNGIEPGSVWAVTLPDGGVAVAAADERGALWLPEGVAAPRRL